MIELYLRTRASMRSDHAPLNEALFPALRKSKEGYHSTNGIEELKQIVARKVGFDFDPKKERENV